MYDKIMEQSINPHKFSVRVLKVLPDNSELLTSLELFDTYKEADLRASDLSNKYHLKDNVLTVRVYE